MDVYRQRQIRMSKIIQRHIKIDNWIFEVKMVRALRVEKYGEPYSAIANINLHGSSAYIDGIMQKSQQKISNQDIEVFTHFCQQMAIDDMTLDSNNSLFTPCANTHYTLQPAAQTQVSKALKQA